MPVSTVVALVAVAVASAAFAWTRSQMRRPVVASEAAGVHRKRPF